MLTLQQLRVFDAVAKHLHFTRAAEALCLTQPGVTFHIHSLERHFGIPLLDVQGHQVSLTAAGEFLQHRMQEVLNAVDGIERSMREFALLQEGWLKLGTTLTIGDYVVAPIITDFHRSHPHVRLSMSIANTAEVERSLLARELDIALVEGRINSPAIVVIPFQTDELVIAVPAGHPLGELREVDAARLVAEPFVLREPGSGTRALALESLGAFAEQLKVVLHMNSTEAIKGAVRAGLGITIISHTIIRAEVERGELMELRLSGKRMTRVFSVAYLEERALSPAAKAFVSFVLQNQQDIPLPQY